MDHAAVAARTAFSEACTEAGIDATAGPETPAEREWARQWLTSFLGHEGMMTLAEKVWAKDALDSLGDQAANDALAETLRQFRDRSTATAGNAAPDYYGLPSRPVVPAEEAGLGYAIFVRIPSEQAMVRVTVWPSMTMESLRVALAFQLRMAYRGRPNMFHVQPFGLRLLKDGDCQEDHKTCREVVPQVTLDLGFCLMT